LTEYTMHLTIHIEVDDSRLAALLAALQLPEIAKAKPVSKKAPYGFKKDGTPRGRPGRPRKA